MCYMNLELINKRDDEITSEIQNSEVCEAAYRECIRILRIQLSNQQIRKSLNEHRILIIPKNKRLTDFEEFAYLEKVISSGGTFEWKTTRGAGGTVGTKKVTAVGEENLVNVATPFDRYNRGYSVLAHEFAHTIHEFGLGGSLKPKIKSLYENYCEQKTEVWVDGPCIEGAICYAARDEKEYFAQSSNAFLGCNMGIDGYTKKSRNNGRIWLMNNDKNMYNLLVEIYGKDSAYVSHCVEDGDMCTTSMVANPGGL